MKTCSSILLILFFSASVLSAIGGTSADGKPEQADQFFQRAEQAGYSGNVLIALKGEVLLRKGYGWQDREKKVKETAETVFDVGSITKQFTAAGILKLQEQGKLFIDDKLDRFVKNVPEDKKSITLKHLLTHTAGFPGAIGDDYDLISADEFVTLAMQTPLESKPGEQYQYSNVGYSLLGIVIEKVSGKKYEQFLHDELFVPAGMMKTGYLIPKFDNANVAVAYRNGERWGTMLEQRWASDGPGWHLKANGGLLSTLDDMHRWYLAIRNHSVLNSPSVNQYLQPWVKEQEEGISFYGLGWVIEPMEDGDTLIWHNGGNGVFNAYMGFSIRNDYVIIISSNSNDKISDDYANVSRQIIKGSYQPLSASQVKLIEGEYRLKSGDPLRVSVDEMDQLHVSFTTKGGLLAVSSDGTEADERVKNYGELTRKIFEAALMKNDFSAFAEARHVPLEVVNKNAAVFFSDLKNELGAVSGIEIVGSVARSRAGLYLTYFTVQFEKGNRHFLLWWRNDKLEEWTNLEKMEKVYDKNDSDVFLAANVGKSIRFADKQMHIMAGSAEAVAVKVD